MVGTIIGHAFRSGIGQHQPACLQYLAMVMIVQGLSVLAQNSRERYHVAIRSGNTVQHTGNVLFGYTWLAKAHGCGMHLVTDVANLVDFLYLARLFYRAQADDCLNQLQRTMLLGQRGTDAGQFFQQQHVVVPVRRQEMDFPVLRDGFVHGLFQFGKRETFAYTYLCRQFFYTGLGTHPDDIIHSDIIAEKIIFASFYVKYSGISRMGMTEEIKERTVLTELVRIVRIVGWCFIVA